MAAPSPKPAMWQLKEPSKPKCVCAHTQFITVEHMANILTHVSRARKTNRARAARGSGPLRRGCAAAARPRSREGGAAGPGAGAGRGSARRPAAPRHCPSARHSAARDKERPGTCALAEPRPPPSGRAPGKPPARARGRRTGGLEEPGGAREPQRSPRRPSLSGAGLRCRRGAERSPGTVPAAGQGRGVSGHCRPRQAVQGFGSSARPLERPSLSRRPTRLGPLAAESGSSRWASAGRLKSSSDSAGLGGRGHSGRGRPRPSRPRTGKVLPAAEARCSRRRALSRGAAEPGLPRGAGQVRGREEARRRAAVLFSAPPGRTRGGGGALGRGGVRVGGGLDKDAP